MKFVRNKNIVVLVLILSVAAAASVSFLWRAGFVSLPAGLVHAARFLRAQISVMPEATVKLDVPFHRQEHSLSCEAATLRMAFLGHGLDVPESELLKYLEFDPTPRRGEVWGDPGKGFVGNIDGKMFGDGYGVHAEPIAKLGLRWLRTESFEAGTAEDLARYVNEGNPVITWGYVGRGKKGSWRTLEGKVVEAVDGEHTRVVYGFTGIPGNPTGFFAVDPIYGHAYWSRDDFMKNWEPLGYMGVVVYPHWRWVRAEGDYRVWEISHDGKTRRWLNISWPEFERMGGFEEAVKVISREELNKYKTL